MKVKGVVYEDFVNYKVPSMFIMLPYCTFKCNKECGREVCQNEALKDEPLIEVDTKELVEKYLENPITKAIVFGGLEPFMSRLDMILFIDYLRNKKNCNDDVVIYTGYTEQEFKELTDLPETYKLQIAWKQVQMFPNIIIKFGRFIPDSPHRFDEVLGVELASSNQYAKRYNYGVENKN